MPGNALAHVGSGMTQGSDALGGVGTWVLRTSFGVLWIVPKAVLAHPFMAWLAVRAATEQWVVDPRGIRLLGLIASGMLTLALIIGMVGFADLVATGRRTHQYGPDGIAYPIRRQPSAVRRAITRREDYLAVKAKRGELFTPAEQVQVKALHWRNRQGLKLARRIEVRERKAVDANAVPQPVTWWERQRLKLWGADIPKPVERVKAKVAEKQNAATRRRFEKAKRDAEKVVEGNRPRLGDPAAPPRPGERRTPTAPMPGWWSVDEDDTPNPYAGPDPAAPPPPPALGAGRLAPVVAAVSRLSVSPSRPTVGHDPAAPPAPPTEVLS